MRKLFIGILLLCFTNTAVAQQFTLRPKGKRFTPTEDLHCLNNAGALKLLTKLKLCPKECEIKLEEAMKLNHVELQFMERRLEL